jgi:hypothetical protein
MVKQKQTAEQHVADKADRKALNPAASRQTISDSQAARILIADISRVVQVLDGDIAGTSQDFRPLPGSKAPMCISRQMKVALVCQ